MKKSCSARVNLIDQHVQLWKPAPLLITDEDPFILSKMEEELRELGYMIVSVGREAVSSYLQQMPKSMGELPDAIILKGADLVVFVRQKWKKSEPVIILRS